MASATATSRRSRLLSRHGCVNVETAACCQVPLRKSKTIRMISVGRLVVVVVDFVPAATQPGDTLTGKPTNSKRAVVMRRRGRLAVEKSALDRTSLVGAVQCRRWWKERRALGGAAVGAVPVSRWWAHCQPPKPIAPASSAAHTKSIPALRHVAVQV